MTKPEHKTRISDSSLYDEKCILCGATDGDFGDLNAEPCRSIAAKVLSAWKARKTSYSVEYMIRRFYEPNARRTKKGISEYTFHFHDGSWLKSSGRGRGHRIEVGGPH